MCDMLEFAFTLLGNKMAVSEEAVTEVVKAVIAEYGVDMTTANDVVSRAVDKWVDIYCPQ
jgi:hypothetical protein